MIPRKTLLLMTVLFLSSSLEAEGLGDFLPDGIASKATKLLSGIDQRSAAIESKRAGIRAEQLLAESDAVEDYALIAASRGSQGAWAKPDGSAVATDASAAYASARARAKAAADTLAFGPSAVEDLAASREAAADSLASLILGSGIKERSARRLEGFLAGKSAALAKIFPDAAAIASLLQRAGTAGAREAAAAMAHRGAQDIARSLLRSRARIAELAPASASSLARLEDAFAVYLAWMAAFPVAAYPGDLESATAEGKAVLSTGLKVVAGAVSERMTGFFAALAEGDGRAAAAAEAARRLAGLWANSPQVGREALASLCGVPYSTLALFSSAFPEPDGEGEASLQSTRTPKASDPISILSSMNALEVSIAEQGFRPSGSAREAEPALLILERPELAAIARSESRYAGFYAEASQRLSSLYAQAASDASATLESSGFLAKAAALALGSPASGISVRYFDFPPPVEAGRRVAFFAVISDASGRSVSLPLPAEAAGVEYSRAFARAAGLRSAAVAVKTDAAALLARYGQSVVSAYDPEGSGDSLAMDSFPRGYSPSRLDDSALELALLGDWRP